MKILREYAHFLSYQKLTHNASAATANMKRFVGLVNNDAPERLVVVKTSSNPMSLELKQFDELTCGTSSGSANVISAH